MRTITFYTLYRKTSDDLIPVEQVDTLTELSELLKMKKSSLKVMISKRQLIKDRYIIIKDEMKKSKLKKTQ